MKKLFLILAIAGLIFSGCDNPGAGITDPASSNETLQAGELPVIKLPASLTPLPMHKKISCMITPESGGVIHYDYTYNSSSGKVKVDIQLRFQPGSVADTLLISAEINLNELSGDLSMNFGPSPTQFSKPALITVNAAGLDSAGIPKDPQKIKLVYIDDNGNIVPTTTKKISIDLKKGEIKIQEGELPHFSRYAFIT